MPAINLPPMKLRVGESIIVDTPAKNQNLGIAVETPVSWRATNQPSPITSSVVAPPVTTTHADSLVILAGFVANDTSAAVFSGSGSPTEAFDENTTLGLDATLFADYFVQALAGSTSSRTSALGGAIPNMGATIALRSSGSVPSFGGVGTVAKVASGDLTPGQPAGAVSTDDVLICLLVQRDNVVATMADASIDPGQWTPIFGVNTIRVAGQELRCSAWWCRIDGVATIDFTITRPAGDAAIAAVLGFGNIIATGSPLEGVATNACISVVQDADPAKASVVGEFPGTIDAISYFWEDPFALPFETQQPVNVLDAATVALNVADIVFDYSNTTPPDPIQVQAFGLDAEPGSPNYALTGIEWAIAGGVATFQGGINTGPIVVLEAAAAGSGTLTVTGKNYQGYTLTATKTITVLAAATVSIERVPS